MGNTMVTLHMSECVLPFLYKQYQLAMSVNNLPIALTETLDNVILALLSI